MHFPSVLVLYSDRDELFKNDLSYYFKEFELRKLIAPTKYYRMQDIHSEWWAAHGDKYDMVILLLSIRLCTQRKFRALLPKLKTEHHCKRISLVPILIGECLIDLKIFDNLELLPQNRKAADSDYWHSRDNFFTAVFAELEQTIVLLTKNKTAHEKLWAKTKNSIRSVDFDFFLQQYPLSKYAQEAKTIRDKYLDRELWTNAIFTKDISSYYTYLQETPLHKHQDEATKIISTIENTESLRWEEIEDKTYLEEMFIYRTYYSDGKHKDEVNELLKNKVEHPFHEIEYKFERTDHLNYFKDLVYTNLQPNEILSFETALRYSESILAKIHTGMKHVKNIKSQTNFEIISLILFFTYLVQQHFFQGYYILTSIVMVLLIIIHLYTLNCQKADEKYLPKAIKHLNSLNIKLKVTYLSHDHQGRQTIMKSLFLLENKVIHINKKSFLSYYLQFKEIDDKELEGII